MGLHPPPVGMVMGAVVNMVIGGTVVYVVIGAVVDMVMGGVVDMVIGGVVDMVIGGTVVYVVICPKSCFVGQKPCRPKDSSVLKKSLMSSSAISAGW